MHMLRLLSSDMFEVQRNGKPSGVQTVFPNWVAHDRFGIVIDVPFGALGATHLIQWPQPCSMIRSRPGVQKGRSIRRFMRFITGEDLAPMLLLISGRRGAKRFWRRIIECCSVPSMIEQSRGLRFLIGRGAISSTAPRKSMQRWTESRRLFSTGQGSLHWALCETKHLLRVELAACAVAADRKVRRVNPAGGTVSPKKYTAAAVHIGRIFP